MPLPTGIRLGPYEVLAPLGAGRMGEVYKGHDTRLDRTVALKVLPGHIANDPELRQRLEREARTISSLNHPHICALYDVGRQDGIDFLVMEYLEGETLVARLAKGALPVDQTVRYGIQIAAALDRAHRAGIVHRDLKPANVMLTKAGAKLLDFGLAAIRPPAWIFGEAPSPSESADPGATFPFWSPDSRSIGFFAEGTLKKIDASGGPAITLAGALNPRGGSWGTADTIVFVPDVFGELLAVPAVRAEQARSIRANSAAVTPLPAAE